MTQRDIGVRSYLPGAPPYHPLNSTGNVVQEGMTHDFFGLVNLQLGLELGYKRRDWGYVWYDFRQGPNEFVLDGTFARCKEQIELYWAQANSETLHTLVGVRLRPWAR